MVEKYILRALSNAFTIIYIDNLQHIQSNQSKELNSAIYYNFYDIEQK